jgi:hypothetical protein
MYQLHERPITGKVSIIAPTVGLTAADIQKADLLLASLYDASLCAERITMKLDCCSNLRRQLISYDFRYQLARRSRSSRLRSSTGIFL